MSDIPFTVHLGGGVYVDAFGNLSQGAVPPGTPVYETPFKLPVDPKKVAAAAADVKKALKDVNKDPAVIAKFEEFGLPLEVLDILSGVAKIAGTVAPVLFVVSFAVDVLKLFGLFKDGPSALEQLVVKRFDALADQVAAIGELIHTQDLRDGRLQVQQFSSEVRNHVASAASLNLTPAQIEAEWLRLLTAHSTHAVGFAKLLDQQTWMSTFRRSKHGRVWARMAHNLFTLPGGPSSAPVPAPLPPDNTLRFDHRLMVPLATWAAETYLACLRGIEPEYRTTGLFRDNLRDYAQKLDRLAQNMREHVLARTIYEAADFAFPLFLDDSEVEQGFLGIGPPVISRRCARFPVGALDLRYHDDDFFGGFLDDLFKAEFFGYAHPTRKAGLELRWVPPATLAPGPFDGTWVITNPQQCADAANAQSASDYADLLSVSGYLELVQLAALLHHEYTVPDRSQTVRGHKPYLRRTAEAPETVTVSSKPILFSEPVTATARRERQRCEARVDIWTQPVKRPRPSEYRVLLRTLRSFGGSEHWLEPTYDEYQVVSYVDDPAQAGFKRLDIQERDLALADHSLVPGWQSSPRGHSVVGSGSARLLAHTFDWWIPVKPPFGIGVDFAQTMVELRSFGWTTPGQRGGSAGVADLDAEVVVGATTTAPTMLARTLGGATPRSVYGSFQVADLIPELPWVPSADQDWAGEHREPREQEVTVEFELSWVGDRLRVRLQSDPADRSYVVFVVVEERIPATGQILHTAVPVPVNGLLTYVPQQFFDDERAAWENALRIVSDFNDRYSEQREPGPLDPVVGWQRPGHLATREGLARILQVAERHEPELLAEVAHRHLR